MKPVKKTNNIYKKKIAVSSSIFALAIGVIVFFAIYPSVRDIISSHESLRREKDYLANRSKEGQIISQVSQKVSLIRPDMEVLDKLFISEDNVLSFESKIEELSSESDVSGLNINVSSDAEEIADGYKSVVLSIQAKGQIGSLMDFINELEKINYYINIKSLDFSKKSTVEKPAEGEAAGEEPAEEIIDLTITAKTYWLE